MLASHLKIRDNELIEHELNFRFHLGNIESSKIEKIDPFSMLPEAWQWCFGKTEC